MGVSVPFRFDEATMNAKGFEDVRIFISIDPNALPAFNPSMKPIINGELHPGSGYDVIKALQNASVELCRALFDCSETARVRPICHHPTSGRDGKPRFEPVIEPEKEWLDLYFYFDKGNLEENGTEKPPVLHLTTEEVVGGVVVFKGRWLERKAKAHINKMMRKHLSFWHDELVCPLLCGTSC